MQNNSVFCHEFGHMLGLPDLNFLTMIEMDDAVRRMADLSGTVLDPSVYGALQSVVGRRRTLVFLDEDAGPIL